MCKQQQLRPFLPSTMERDDSSSAESEKKGKSGFLSCGVDRSCPKSVTTAQNQEVRLDQYQSSIAGGNRKKRCRRESSIGATTAAIATQSLASVSARFNTSINILDPPKAVTPDHDFEWYDLDAIHEVDNINSQRAMVVGHDFHAGLVFMTERQILETGVQINFVNNSSIVHGIRNKNNGQDFDLFFWVNHDHNKFEETKSEREEREFQERMEELEQEIHIDCMSLSSLSGSSISNPLENFDEMDASRDAEEDFFGLWRFTGPIIGLK